LTVDEAGIRIEARTGMVSKREFELDYADIEEVRSREQISNALILETPGTQYVVPNVTAKVTANVTANDDAMDDLMRYIRGRVARAKRGRSQLESGTATPEGASADGGAAASATSVPRSGPEAGADAGIGGDGTGDGHDASNVGDAEAIRKWAELHDQGLITQEEFERKKRELLCPGTIRDAVRGDAARCRTAGT